MNKKLPKIIVAGLIKKGNKFLLIKEQLSDGKYWIIPGGTVEFGESLEQALEREIKEEIGLKIQDPKFLAFKEAIFVNNNYHTIIFFYLITKYSGEIILEEGKVLEAKFFSKSEVKKSRLVESAEWLFENHILMASSPSP